MMKGASLRSLALVCVVGATLTGCVSGPASELAVNQGDNTSVAASSSIPGVATVSGSTSAESSKQIALSESSQRGTDEIAAELSSAEMAFIRSRPHKVAPFPLVLNRTVERYVQRFADYSVGIKASFRRSRPYLPAMVKVLEKHGLPPDLVYLSFAESSFSSKGSGPWQLCKATARRFHLKVNRYVDERRDPIMSTRAAADYLATLHKQAGDWHITLVAWNQGEAALNRYWSLRGVKYNRLIAHLPHDTRALLNRFMAVAIIAHHAERYGIEPVDFSEPPQFFHVTVKGGTPLRVVAKHSGISVRTLRKYNPALLSNRVPPNVTRYKLRIPFQMSARADAGKMFSF